MTILVLAMILLGLLVGTSAVIFIIKLIANIVMFLISYVFSNLWSLFIAAFAIWIFFQLL